VRFAADRRKRRASDLAVEDVDPELVLAFLDHVEGERGNAARSRNARFAAIPRSSAVSSTRPSACLEQALRIRTLPMKRTDRALIDHLTREEIQARLVAPTSLPSATSTAGRVVLARRLELDYRLTGRPGSSCGQGKLSIAWSAAMVAALSFHIQLANAIRSRGCRLAFFAATLEDAQTVTNP
jgi:hypothetical protein